MDLLLTQAVSDRCNESNAGGLCVICPPGELLKKLTQVQNVSVSCSGDGLYYCVVDLLSILPAGDCDQIPDVKSSFILVITDDPVLPLATVVKFNSSYLLLIDSGENVLLLFISIALSDVNLCQCFPADRLQVRFAFVSPLEWPISMDTKRDSQAEVTLHLPNGGEGILNPESDSFCFCVHTKNGFNLENSEYVNLLSEKIVTIVSLSTVCKHINQSFVMKKTSLRCLTDFNTPTTRRTRKRSVSPNAARQVTTTEGNAFIDRVSPDQSHYVHKGSKRVNKTHRHNYETTNTTSLKSRYSTTNDDIKTCVSPTSSTSSLFSTSSHFTSPSYSSSVLSVIVIILLIVSSNARLTSAETKKVRIHAIIPEHFAMMKDLSREFRSTLVNFRRDSRFNDLRRVFSVREDLTFLHHDTPTEILETFCKHVLNGENIAIININNPLGIRRRSSSSRYILNLAQYWGIPVISWDTEFSGIPQSEYEYRTLQLAPTVNHQARAMVSLLDRYNWTHFSIITSQVAGDSEFVTSLENIVEARRKMPPSANGIRRKRLEILSTVHIDDYKKSKERMKRFVGSDTRVFLLHCNSIASYSIFEAANALGITGRDYVWILTRPCIPMAKYAAKSFPVGLIGLSFDYGIEAMKVVLRVSLKTWLHALLSMAHRPAMVKNMDIPPKLSCQSQDQTFWKDGGILYDYMLNVTIPKEPDIVFNRNGTLRKTDIAILNLQWVDGQRKYTQWKEVGSWKRYGLKMKDITWPGESPMAPSGKPKRAFLRVSTLYEMPYVLYRNVTDKGTCEENALPCHVYVRDNNKNILQNGTQLHCCVGLSMDLLKILSTELNFDMYIEEVKDGNWGGTDTEGNWNGLVKALLDDECDMVVTSLKINPERASAIQFSVPYLETGIKIIVALRNGAISPTAFLEPYDLASWSLILIFSVHATGSSILIFEWLSPKGLNRGLTPLREHKFSLFRSFWLIWAMLFSTSVQTDSPRGIASRFLANIWALFALVFLASYTANLAAFMITKEEYYDLSGIKDYRLQNPYVMNPPFKYATTAYGSTEAMLKTNHKNMYKYMKKLNLPDVKAGIRALKAGDIQAFIYDSSVLEYYASRDTKCRLVTVGNRYAMTGYGIGFQPNPNNPWIDKVNRVILRLQENGELDRLQKFWLAGACDMKKEAGVSNRTLGILNFTSAFILLGTGILLGLLLLVLEHIYFKFGRSYLRKVDKCGCCALVSLSMGRSLRMEDTVSEAMNLVAKNRCKDPICETQMWKLKHKLDMALLKIENLEMQLSVSEEEVDETALKSITSSPVFYDQSIVPNHQPKQIFWQPQPSILHQPQQQQPQSSYSLPNNIGNHNSHQVRLPSNTSSPHGNNSPLFEVHTIPEVSYSKDLNGGSCHIKPTIPEEEFDNPNTVIGTSTKPGNNLLQSRYPEFPPSYSDCANDDFPEDDGRYTPYVLDDIDSEGGSTHSTTTTSLGVTATGKISPWPGLKRSPSYTSAVGGSFGSDIDNKSPNANKSRKYDGKTYMGVSGL